MKNQILKKLYETISGECVDRDPFISEEAHILIDRFLHRYFKDEDTLDDAYVHLIDIIDAIQQSTFEKTFYITFDLMQH